MAVVVARHHNGDAGLHSNAIAGGQPGGFERWEIRTSRELRRARSGAIAPGASSAAITGRPAAAIFALGDRLDSELAANARTQALLHRIRQVHHRRPRNIAQHSSRHLVEQCRRLRTAWVALYEARDERWRARRKGLVELLVPLRGLLQRKSFASDWYATAQAKSNDRAQQYHTANIPDVRSAAHMDPQRSVTKSYTASCSLSTKSSHR